ncbi:MAG: MmcQ/YjbR family DNA-binding protein [Rhodococcus sp. (in: high G+C Gram-positive bacteria)]
MSDYPDVPEPVLSLIRHVCTSLPEVVEEAAWTGTRWQIRSRTFAHVLVVEPERPEAFARAGRIDSTSTVLTFRSEAPEYDVLVRLGHPFFRAPWGEDTVGLIVADLHDSDEIRELLTDSYCILAPQKLVEAVDRPEI